ncbi:hypothetical protein ADIARSV_1916 [Arcticibacter svalbardensis MN12-7]|uniref:Surface layer protein n=1 Tax=Arcticibacter svalbardensis MN12-7 TaxID=1150600 RepID=R9GTS9_9SPHI|nr:YncE family protein [Arcticibacter svalbardensis]EOR94955.1 hypothetical protein ADIARSV_1916 [Arcticibacter svalbardensis MN12-7]
MKQLKLKFLLSSLLVLTILGSCKKDRIEDGSGTEPTAERQGIYVLSQGGINLNNSTLSYFDYDNRAFTFDQFNKVNNRGLGDTGNDVQVYGSKMYIVVNVSSTIEVVNARTAVSIKKIDVKNGTTARQPRSIVFDKNKAFISCFDGTVAVMDTASLTIDKYITVGRNPEGMAIANGKLYVANSGGLGWPNNYDKTVSVIDLTTLTETKKITVVDNPGSVVADQYGDVYVLSVGNYTTINASMAIIDSKTDVVKSQKDFTSGSIAISGDYAYITKWDGTVQLFNVKTELLEKENFISDGTSITSPYGVAVDDISGEVFVTDAKNYSTNGEVFCFDKTGTLRYRINVGISPSKVVFINK